MTGVSGVGVFWAFASILSAIISCVGYFMPHWITGQMTLHLSEKDIRNVPVHFGIFRRCNYPALGDDGTLTVVYECGRYTDFKDIPSVSWQITALTVGAGCILCFLVALTAMFGICVKGVVMPTVARTAGIIQMCSGNAVGLCCVNLRKCVNIVKSFILMHVLVSHISKQRHIQCYVKR